MLKIIKCINSFRYKFWIIFTWKTQKNHRLSHYKCYKQLVRVVVQKPKLKVFVITCQFLYQISQAFFPVFSIYADIYGEPLDISKTYLDCRSQLPTIVYLMLLFQIINKPLVHFYPCINLHMKH